MERRHKAIWLAIVLALFYLEDKAIDEDRSESETRQQEALRLEQRQFAKVLADSQQHFDETLGEMRDLEGTSKQTLSLSGTALRQITGGSSYLYYECQMPLGPIEMDVPGAKKGSMILNGVPRLVGRYPLHNVHIEVAGPTGWVIGGPAPALEYGTFGPEELGRSRAGLQLAFMPDNPKQFFAVFINTSNGSYDQIILVRKFGDRWLWASRLYKMPSRLPIHTWAADGFPKSELKPDASWD
jgi:hypothetical protein